jgi:hypothetical protein
MLKTEEHIGYWFIPGAEDKSYNGTLTFGPGQPIKLKLSTQEQSNDFDERFHPNDPFTMCGRTLKGELITLLNCLYMTSNSPVGGFLTISYEVDDVIIGAHITDRENTFISEVRISFDHIEKWMNIFGFEVETYILDSNYNLTYKKPEDISFILDDNVTGKITFWNNSAFGLQNESEITLKQQNLFHLLFNTPISIAEVKNLIWKLQRFLTLMTQQKVRIKWLYIYSVGVISNNYSITEENALKDIQLFYEQEFYDFKDVHRGTYLLKFEDFKIDFERVIQNWFRMEIELKPVTDILYYNIKDLYDDIYNSFLNVVQGVEAYHRRIIQDTEALKEVHKNKLDRILPLIINDDDKAWVEQKLKFSYETTLPKRLTCLIDQNKHILFLNLDNNKKEIKKIIQRIADIRNYLTHFDKLSEHNNPGINELSKLFRLVKSLLTIIILRELDIEEELIAKAINSRFKYRLGSNY